jgi:hypothetical protein
MTTTHPLPIEVSRSLRPNFQEPYKARTRQMRFAPTSPLVGLCSSTYAYGGGAFAHLKSPIVKMMPR